jgi:hypothetical protein
MGKAEHHSYILFWAARKSDNTPPALASVAKSGQA